MRSYKPILSKFIYYILISISFISIVILDSSRSYAEERFKNIHLRGTITGGVIEPFVIIEDITNGEQSNYQLHEVLDGMEIVEIRRDMIILKDNNGNKWDLSSWGGFFKHKEEIQHEESKIITYKKEQLVPETLLKYIKSKPRKEQQREDEPINATGVVVTYIEKGSIFDRMNIKTGDVILQFNEHLINKTDDLNEAITNIPSAPEGMMRIGLSRNGQFQSRYGSTIDNNSVEDSNSNR